MRAEAKLKELGLELLEPKQPMANFVLTVQTGNLLFVSGHVPPDVPELAPYKDKKGPDGALRVGRDITAEEGAKFARYVGLNCLSSVKGALGDLDRVKRVVKLLGMVTCTEDFTRTPQVINGCSDLMVEVFGEAGRHARSAVGMQALPLGVPVEIEMILEVE